MRITHLSLKNFRGFEHFELDLSSQVTLLLGKNAVGKTAVLDGLAIAIGEWLRGTATANLEGRRIVKLDARLVRQEGGGLPTANPSYPIEVAAKGELAGEAVEWGIKLRTASGRSTRDKGIRDAAELSENQASAGSGALPVIAYYGTARLWVQKKAHRKEGDDRLWSRMDGYASCLNFASNTKLLAAWMRDQRLRFLEAQEAGHSDMGIALPHLKAVADAAVGVVDGAKRFFYSLSAKELQVEFEDGQLIGFDLLSDGQHTLMLLAADLAWRTAQLNPQFGADAPSKTSGIALIDEVELHLHPAWQRTVISNLTRMFPNVQFIITTHSPQVIATAEASWIRVLEGGKQARHVSYSKGRDSNSVLKDIMGVGSRPDAMEARLAELGENIERGKLPEARATLEQLRSQLGVDSQLDALEWDLCDEEEANAGDS